MPQPSPSIITVPFSQSGSRNSIPTAASSTPGLASYTTGFPAITMTPIASGGIAPAGPDFNGVLYDITTNLAFLTAGQGYVWNSTIATAIGGYAVGAWLARADGGGYWINTVAGNSTNPDAGGAGWAPSFNYGQTTVALTNTNVTLTALQYAKATIVLTGALTGNVQVIFPTLYLQWLVVNETTGPFTVTAKTPSGTGIIIPQGGAATPTQVYGDGVNLYAVNPPPPTISVLNNGLVANSPSAAAANAVAFKALVAPASAGGVSTFTGNVVFPNLSGSDVYYIGDFCQIRYGISLDLGGSTLNFTKTSGATVSDTNNSFLFWLGNVNIFDGKISVNYTMAGGASNAGCAIGIGARGTPVGGSPLPTIYDSLLPAAYPQMGNSKLWNLSISSNVVGGFGIFILGGVQDVEFNNVIINGQSALNQGVYGEYGWATNQTSQCQRQTSHPHNIRFTNYSCSNLAGSTAQGIQFNGGYQIVIDGIYVNGSAGVCAFGSGESLFFRPWVTVDDIGSIVPSGRVVTVKNITGRNISGTAITLTGATKAVSGSLFGWTPTTQYFINDEQINGAGLYTCTAGGISAGSGGPSGTGTGIVDGGVTWNYVGLSYPYETEQLRGVFEGIVCDGGASSGGYGIRASGPFTARNGKLTNMQRGIVTETECVSYDIDTFDILNSSSFGIEIGLVNNVYVGRLSHGKISGVFIAGCNGTAAIGGTQIGNLVLESSRFGYTIAQNGIAETTQLQALTLDSTCSNVLCLNNVVAATNGVEAYRQQPGATSSNGNTIQGGAIAAGVTPTTGFWNNILAGVSPDNGDASVTVVQGSSFQTQNFNTPLTAARAVSFTTSSMTDGFRVRTVRGAGATGAFNLTVGAKVLATAGTWVEHQYSAAIPGMLEVGSGAL